MVTAMGGWVDRRSIDCYLRFAEVLFRRYKDVVKYWIPFNEINDLTTAVGNWNPRRHPEPRYRRFQPSGGRPG